MAVASGSLLMLLLLWRSGWWWCGAAAAVEAAAGAAGAAAEAGAAGAVACILYRKLLRFSRKLLRHTTLLQNSNFRAEMLYLSSGPK
jgi:hypothetical protein